MLEFDATEWQGVDGFGLEALERLRQPAEDGVVLAAMHFQEGVKKTLEGKRSGRIYKVSKTGKPHIASAPGEAPAIMFGQLYRSIAVSPPEWDGWAVAASIGTNLAQARRLEFGGVDSRGVRILPRPYFEPTVLREMAAVEALLQRIIDEAA